MALAALTTQPSLPEWTSTFLSARCDALTAHLAASGGVISLDEETDAIHCWRLVLLAAADLPDRDQAVLDELHLLHARIAERLARGGLADISADLESLVRSILVDRLRELTDRALGATCG